MKKESNINLWGIVGKVAALLTIVWGSIQLINYFVKPSDYKISVLGNTSAYKQPYDHQDLIKEYTSILALDKAYKENVNKKSLPIDGLKEYFKKSKNKISFNYDYEKYMKYESVVNNREYTKIWTFKIKNLGKKPLEELLLELPYKGSYMAKWEKGMETKGYFENRIELSVLAPGYSVKIDVWVDDKYSYSFNKEKTRITHKYGWKQIDYPIEAKGILAWNIRNNNTPLLVLIFILIVLIVIAFAIGIEYGPKFKEKEDKRKLKAAEELEVLKSKQQSENLSKKAKTKKTSTKKKV